MARSWSSTPPRPPGMTSPTAPVRRIRWKRPFLYAKQEEAIFHDDRFGWIEASTKSGKTVSCIVWLAEQAVLYGRPGYNGWWVAPTYRQAMMAMGRMIRFLPKGTVHASQNVLTFTHNGAKLWFLTGEKPDGLYGDDVHAVVIDEASRCREGAWIAIRSTITATRGPVRAIGNVKGRKNWFYRACRLAQGGLVGHHYAMLTATDAVEAGVLAAGEIEEARRDLPDKVFRELYFNEASEDGSNPFGMDHLRACASLPTLAPGPAVVWGVDLARLVDWTVAIGLNAKGQLSAIERWQSSWATTTERIATLVGSADAYIDATGVGDPITEALMRVCPRAKGFTITGQSKQHLMERLATVIQQPDRPLTWPGGSCGNAAVEVLLSELDNFEYESTRTGVRYQAPEGQHDDTVLALAMAWMMYEERTTRAPYARRTTFDPF